MAASFPVTLMPTLDDYNPLDHVAGKNRPHPIFDVPKHVTGHSVQFRMREVMQQYGNGSGSVRGVNLFSDDTQEHVAA